MLRALILAFAATTASAADITGTVTRVVDGQTLVIGDRTVRIAGMSAPPMDQHYGIESHGALVLLCHQQPAYARITAAGVADVWCGRTHVAADLIVRGHARAAGSDYSALEDDARRLRRGMWAPQDSAPAEQRRTVPMIEAWQRLRLLPLRLSA